ncbi:FxLYD domain-containing protein [Paenibacillus sp. L3-i20]|uniref:FxLYD domain-containing protein n=1 Tax=Paenibacillus sp. L3-i20 TaxID=2905833 RepID=UPI0020BDEDEC|nr:FxLYD domain-containing protein [Paenibacillus sp. L3-i20]
MDENAIWPGEQMEGAASLEVISVRNDIQRIAISGEGSVIQSEAMQSKKNWIMPISLLCLAFIVTASVFYYFQYEKNINEDVLNLQTEAKTAALGGEYKKALDLLSKAAKVRPAFAPIKADKDIIQHVIEVKLIADDVEKQLSNNKIKDAEAGVNLLRSELSGHKEPIYDKLRERLDALQMKMTIQQLQKQLETLVTVEEHADMLKVVNGLFGEEAIALKDRVLVGIRKLTLAEVEGLLKRKNFTDALSVVEESLFLVKGDADLTSLMKRVEDEQKRYEQAEQQRIEQAMQRAAEEDLINQTAAVEVVSTDHTLDEFGDLTIVGVMKNAATRPIYEVKVEFTVQSMDGEVFGKGSASATPNYIEPGEQLSYTATIYGVNTKDVVVVVDHATWYLD